MNLPSPGPTAPQHGESDEQDEAWRHGGGAGGGRRVIAGAVGGICRRAPSARPTGGGAQGRPRRRIVVHPSRCHPRRAGPLEPVHDLGVREEDPHRLLRAGTSCARPTTCGPFTGRGSPAAGETIVIVDSFGSPTIRHDLAVFDAAYKLSPPPSFTMIQPAGAVPPYGLVDDRAGWAGETTLDVEYAHTMAPGANILLVETPTSENEGTTGFPQIVTAEEYVIENHLGDVISQSFSATEQTFPTAQSLLALRSAYIDAAERPTT